jgi:hypothetical protein
MEAAVSCKMLIPINQIIWHHIPEERNHHSHHLEKPDISQLESWLFHFYVTIYEAPKINGWIYLPILLRQL